MNDGKISICIPTYEMVGFGTKMLTELLESTFSQTYKNIEIIVSDHSKDDCIENLCKNYDVKYFRCTDSIGIPSVNTNNAIANATGEYVKIMNQDDFFYTNDALEKMYNAINLEKEKSWLCTACIHCDENSQNFGRIHVPTFSVGDKSLLNGGNSVGCPSVVMFKNDNNYFDRNIYYIIDAELYYALGQKYENPVIIQEPLVSIRIWKNNLSKLMGNTNELIQKESTYLKTKYNL